MGRARKAIEALAELAPDTAVVRRPDGEREVPVAELVVGDTVVDKPNERIPAVGFVLDVPRSENSASLTGERLPGEQNPGSTPAKHARTPTKLTTGDRTWKEKSY